MSAGRLSEYPKLAQWYLARSWERDSTPKQALLARFSELLESETPVVVAISAFETFSQQSKDHPADWQAFENALAEFGLSLGELLSRLCEASLKSTDPRQNMMEATARLATLTDDDALRFLCAWLCINTGDLPGCLANCDMISQPTSSVFALQGQAHLESGLVDKAVQDLQVAVQLSPGDVMFWFQLARACYVSKDMDQAWGALAKASRLDRHNPEIAHFMAIIALTTFATDPGRASEAWNHLSPLTSTHGRVDVVAIALINLAVRTKDESGFLSLLGELDLATLARSSKLVSGLAQILRSLHDRGWQRGSQVFIDGVTNHFVEA